MANKSDLKRWSGWLALVIAFSVACALLSNWQFSRREEALAAMHQVAMNYDSPAVGIDSLATPNSFNPKNQWRQANLRGHYLLGNSVLVRNRPLDGQPGFLSLVPFQLIDGRIIAIERGWIASDDNYSAPKTYPLPSPDVQQVIVRLRPSEPTLDRNAPMGQLATINIEALVKSQGIKDQMFMNVYGRMVAESIPASRNFKALAKPELDEGNHLSYALQWIMFALMAMAALYWGIKKEREAKYGKKRAKSGRKSIGQEDADIEDALS